MEGKRRIGVLVAITLLFGVLSVTVPTVASSVSGTIETDKLWYYEGDRVFIDWSCSSNGAHIHKVTVHASYQPGPGIYDDLIFPEPNAVSISGHDSFQVPDTGTFEVGVFCLDTDVNTIYVSKQAIVYANNPPTYGPPTVWTDKSEYDKGDTITVSWECPFDVETVRVVANVGGVELHRNYYAFETEGEASFVASSSGTVDYRVTCINSDGNGWGNDEQVVVHNVIQDDTDGNGDSSEQNASGIYLPVMLLFIVLSIILLVVVVVLARRGKQQPPSQ